MEVRGVRALSTRAKFRPERGLTVALLGPDGAGKSVVSTCALEALAMPAHRIYMGVNLESSNLVLPSTRLLLVLKRRQGGRPDLTPSTLGANSIARRPQWLRSLRQALVLLNLMAEEWFRQVVIWKHLRHGEVVLLDRHFLFDYYATDVAPLERVPWLRRLHGAMLDRVYPRPDLAIVLDAPAEVLHARKGEGTLEWLEQRREMYLHLRTEAAHSVVMDATQPLDEVVAEVVNVIREQMGQSG